MGIKKWFLDRHPQRYHMMALLLALVALSVAISGTILAQDAGTSTSTTISDTAVSCSYSYSDWNACQSDGKRYRTVISYSPSGCVATSSPDLHESCTYTAPQCSYSYSAWSTCQSNGQQSRTLLSKSPSGCEERAKSVLTQSCTYTAPTPTSTSTTTTACSYGYSSWGSCQPENKRYRSVTGTTPSGCVQTTTPSTVESCSYSGATTSSTSATQCLYTYTAWGVCTENGKRGRNITSKSPSGCVEYVKPVMEQSCIYDSGATATESTATSTPTTATATTTNTAGTGSVTPTFSFSNVSEGMTLRGTFEIRSSVQGASSVEYYLVPTKSNTYKYIGSGKRVSDTAWSLDFRSKEFPNGEFYLRAKVKNAYGEYGSGQRKIHIANESVAGTSTNTTTGFVVIGMTPEEKLKTLEVLAEELQIPDNETGEGKAVVTPDQKKKHIFDYCESNPEKCFPERDSDQDGLSDIDEVRYGSNPKSADSDLDGFIDGDEVKNGFDPLKYSSGDQGDRIVFEDPKVAGETKEKIYAVKTVELKETEPGKRKMQLTGKGLPNSFVTIYVYSDPIVLTVKTDSDGNWVYELDKELEDGAHEVYVAVTDNTGKITGKSEPLAFVKTAQAVTIIPAVQAEAPTDTSPVTESRVERDVLLLIAIVIAALAVALATIGLMRHRHHLLPETPPQP